jgi:transcriptional regulator with AAA-type ATPase domain
MLQHVARLTHPMVAVRELGELPTRTESDSSRGVAEEWALGIFWVSPEERFDELAEGVVIGRGQSCALRLEGEGVSRAHARIERDGPVWILRDLESKNGTSLNGRAIQLAPLCERDTLRVSEFVGVVCRMPRPALQRRAYFAELVAGAGFSAPTLARLSGLGMAAAGGVSIILHGETGSGKEVLARAIHQLSGRSGAFVALNCAAIPEALAESQLFGHKKGAFTGALESAPGQIAAAAGGSLFLDEVSELPLSIQAKLLRSLEERAVTPVGSTAAVPVDFRLIAACQEPLDVLVERGEFRADLYARLHGTQLELPPLRERRQEVLRLLRQALIRAGAVKLPSFEGQALELLCAYDWPYNVREVHQLASVLEASGRMHVQVAHLPERFRMLPEEERAAAGSEQPSSRRHAWVARYAVELDRLKLELARAQGNVSEAARASGIPRHRARRLLEAEAALDHAERRG